MPLHSRVWIYQSIREFSKNEITQVETKSESFISEWTSHGETMSACIQIFHNRFIIVCGLIDIWEARIFVNRWYD